MALRVLAAHQSWVPTAAGLFWLASASADIHGMMVPTCNDWWLLSRVEVLLVGSLWVVSGWYRRRVVACVLCCTACVTIWDLASAVLNRTPRHLFGRVSVDHTSILIADSIIAYVFIWCYVRGGRKDGELRPRRLLLAASTAMSIGIAIDWSQVGQYPMEARAGSLEPSGGLAYLTYLPGGYHSANGRWPLILDLHGSGSVGYDLSLVRGGGLPRQLEGSLKIPFVVVAPQSPRPHWDPGSLDALIGEVLERFRIDPERVYMTGFSMGGRGVWELALADPGRFAAIAPVSGWGDVTSADRLRGVPTWAFHGADDEVVPAENSEKMIAAQRQAGGEAELTIYPGVGHDVASMTYQDHRLYRWLLVHRLSSTNPAPHGPRPDRRMPPRSVTE